MPSTQGNRREWRRTTCTNTVTSALRLFAGARLDRRQRQCRRPFGYRWVDKQERGFHSLLTDATSLGYEIRNFPMCLAYIRDQLHEVDRLQPMIITAIWIMYGHLLTEEKTSTMSTDIIHNYLTNTVKDHKGVCPTQEWILFCSLGWLSAYQTKRNWFVAWLHFTICWIIRLKTVFMNHSLSVKGPSYLSRLVCSLLLDFQMEQSIIIGCAISNTHRTLYRTSSP